MSPARQKSLIVPREHGAWGILLVPLATGAAAGISAGGLVLPLVPLIVAALALFWLRTPVEAWLATTAMRVRGDEELRLVRRVAVALAAVSALALVWLLWGGRNRALWWMGAGAAAAFLAQAILKKTWRGARMTAQMIGAAGLTATAPAAYYVATGQLSSTAWVLWAANFLFAVNQIQFVQLRIHALRSATRLEKLAMGQVFFAGQVVLGAVIAAAGATHMISWFAAIAFVPLLARGFAWFLRPATPLAVRTLGWSELAYAIGFGVLLVLGS